MMWDERYRVDEYVYGTEPNAFLVAECERIPVGGRVLCLAEGEGRNGVFLAGRGYRVTGVDQSAVGLAKAERLASERGVDLEVRAADLGVFDLGVGWSGIVSVFAHVPPEVRKRVHGQVRGALVEGGVFILEAYTIRQLGMPGKGGPPVGQEALFMSLEEVRAELVGMGFEVGREVEREVNEGVMHRGMSAVVQVVAVAR